MMETLEKAEEFARRAHGKQLYSGMPYFYHLNQVRLVLVRFGFHDPDLQVAALLHDVIEDTPTNFSDVFRAFGPEVAELVYAVTDELGRNRVERHAKTYPKIKGNELATTLKLADRIANVEHALRAGVQDKFWMYKREHQEFVDALGQHGPSGLWQRLNDLMDRTIFKAPQNCGFVDQDLACLGCGNRRGSEAYCNLSPELA